MKIFRRLGYGHKARVLYGLWILSITLTLWFGVAALDYDWEREREFFQWTLGIGGAGLVFLYAMLIGYERVAEHPSIRKAFKHGQGGSARFGGAGTFAKYEWCGGAAPVNLGRTTSKYDPRPGGREIGVDDENHLVTFAQSGAGKSTTVIWRNLVKHAYPDSVFILDPKGEHAQNTAMQRAAIGQRVVILDPFHLTKGLQTHGFNPLAHIDVNSPRAAENIKAIGDSNVIPSAKSSDTGAHFDKLQRAMIAGIVAHTLTTEPRENHNLPFVYDRLMDLGDQKSFESFLEAMRGNRACGDLPRRAVTMYDMAGRNEKGSIFTSTITNVEWVASEGMRTLLLGDDLQLSQLRTERLSLYLVLDFEAMKPEFQGRFMRLVTNLAFEACRITPLPNSRANRRTLFMLDEVAQLGPMPSLQGAYQTLRGANVKLWTFYQQYSGLSNQIDDTSAVTGNSTKQFFGCNDPVTAEQIEKYLGKYRFHDGARQMQLNLLDKSEILDTLGQKNMVQIVITGEGDKMELTRERFIPQALPTTEPPPKTTAPRKSENPQSTQKNTRTENNPDYSSEALTLLKRWELPQGFSLTQLEGKAGFLVNEAAPEAVGFVQMDFEKLLPFATLD